MTFRTISAALGSMAIAGIFVLLLPYVIGWMGEYRALLSQYLDGAVYGWLIAGALPALLVGAGLAAMLAVMWPVE